MKSKIMHVVGNRPQFVKLSALSRELCSRGYEEIIVHTGQHYDKNMSDIFFRQFSIKKPDLNLNIGSGTHAEITARALTGIEKALLNYKPSMVFLYGDTDSTLAAALATVKLNIPIVHVEAGPRTYDKNNPEERNRLIVDHISAILCCPDATSLNNLKKEGINDNAYFTGDVMYDSYLFASQRANIEKIEEYSLVKNNYILMTWHRQENTATIERMKQILDFIEEVSETIICPLHPRTLNMLKKFDLYERAMAIENFQIIEPVGYFEMIAFIKYAKLILTDSGGLSKESSFAKVKCLFMLEVEPWPDLVSNGWIQKINFDDRSCVEQKINFIKTYVDNNENIKLDYYGDGKAAQKIVDLLKQKGMI